MRFLFVLLVVCFAFSCAGKPPFLEYTLAQKAINSARQSNSEQNAGLYWRKALNYYRQGEYKFKERDYITAGRLFNQSRKWAEKAENLSRFKTSTGDAE